MIITCPECKARYNIKDELIPERGKNVRCKKCQTAFRTFQDGSVRLLVQKKKTPKPPASVVQPDVGMVHSTVRVDASALQAAMKKQFEDHPQDDSPAIPEFPSKEAPARESNTDFDPFQNMQDSDEFEQVQIPQPPTPPDDEEITPQADSFATQAHSVMKSEPDEVSMPEESGNEVPVSNKPDDSDSDLNLDNLFPSVETKPQTEKDPFEDSLQFDETPEDRDPLADSGNFGFSVRSQEEQQESSAVKKPSLFDSLDPENDDSYDDEPDSVPDESVSMPEEPFSFESEVEVPERRSLDEEEPDVRPESEPSLFDVSIDGTVYSKINLSTLDRWVREGRLLESDQVSVSGLAQYRQADSVEEISHLFGKYFNVGASSSDKNSKPKKKGFFAKLFGK